MLRPAQAAGRRIVTSRPDEQRFLMVRNPNISTDGEMPRQFNVILNWFQELRERVPVD